MDEPKNLLKLARNLAVRPKGVFTFSDRLLAEPNLTAPIPPNKFGAISCGHPNCPGCGVTLAARHAIDAAMRAASGQLAVINAANHLEELPALRSDGRSRLRLMAHGAVGLDGLAGPFERGDDVLWVFYDKESDMNEGGLVASKMALGIVYTATASVAELRDLESKIAKAINLHGTRYIHVHAPCPLSTGVAPRHTIRLARLAVESGIFPLFEAENGALTSSHKIRHRISVSEYLKPQKRFAHLGNEDPTIARWQQIADNNITKYKLFSSEERGR